MRFSTMFMALFSAFSLSLMPLSAADPGDGDHGESVPATAASAPSEKKASTEEKEFFAKPGYANFSLEFSAKTDDYKLSCSVSHTSKNTYTRPKGTYFSVEQEEGGQSDLYDFSVQAEPEEGRKKKAFEFSVQANPEKNPGWCPNGSIDDIFENLTQVARADFPVNPLQEKCHFSMQFLLEGPSIHPRAVDLKLNPVLMSSFDAIALPTLPKMKSQQLTDIQMPLIGDKMRGHELAHVCAPGLRKIAYGSFGKFFPAGLEAFPQLKEICGTFLSIPRQIPAHIKNVSMRGLPALPYAGTEWGYEDFKNPEIRKNYPNLELCHSHQKNHLSHIGIFYDGQPNDWGFKPLPFKIMFNQRIAPHVVDKLESLEEERQKKGQKKDPEDGKEEGQKQRDSITTLSPLDGLDPEEVVPAGNESEESNPQPSLSTLPVDPLRCIADFLPPRDRMNLALTCRHFNDSLSTPISALSPITKVHALAARLGLSLTKTVSDKEVYMDLEDIKTLGMPCLQVHDELLNILTLFNHEGQVVAFQPLFVKERGKMVHEKFVEKYLYICQPISPYKELLTAGPFYENILTLASTGKTYVPETATYFAIINNRLQKWWIQSLRRQLADYPELLKSMLGNVAGIPDATETPLAAAPDTQKDGFV